MKTETSIFLLTAAIGLGFASAPAVAVPETVTNRAVAPARCQAFTPGPSNTGRGRFDGRGRCEVFGGHGPTVPEMPGGIPMPGYLK